MRTSKPARPRPVIQLERTGCGIASVANVVGVDYQTVQRRAAELGITAADPTLWSHIKPVRLLLREFGWRAATQPKPFRSWHTIPPLALLAIKWHREEGTPFWHWVVFKRDDGDRYVLDSNARLRHNVRHDFGRMRPRWFLPISRKVTS